MALTTDFLPRREADLLVWTGTFSTGITADYAAVGLTTGQASAYATLRSSFAGLYAVANANETRSPSNIIAKDNAKALLIAKTRELAGIVQRFPGTTDTLRSELGLTVPDHEPTPIDAPTVAPEILVKKVVSRTVSLTLQNPADPERRGKAPGIAGAAIFSHVGNSAPVSRDEWMFEANASRMSFDIVFPDTVAPGAKVWFTAYFFSPRFQSGPSTEAVSAYLQGGAASASS